MIQRVPFDVWCLILESVMMKNDCAYSSALPSWKLVCKQFHRAAQKWQTNMISLIKNVGCEFTLTTVGGSCNMCKTVYLGTGIPVAQLYFPLGLSKCYCCRCVVNKSHDIRQAKINALIELSKTIRLFLGEGLEYTN